MKKLLTIPALILTTLSFVNVSANEKPFIDEYAFEKNILVKDYGEIVKIPLDKEVLKNVKEDFSNFAIFNQKNENVPFDIYIEDFQKLKTVDVVDVSSIFEIEGANSKKSDIADDNHFTIFNFSERIDRKDASWALFDLKEPLPLGRIEIFVPERSKISAMEIKAGNSADDLKTIVAKRSVKPIYNKISLSTPNYRYVKVSFWGVNIRVEDIEFTTAKNGFVYFTPETGNKYNVKYGNTNLKFFEFGQRLAEESNVVKIAYFSKQKWNKRAKEDLDGDGKNNEEDNCPFVSNSFQSDSDDDGIGNDCDNAPKAKNYDQADIDNDGVGDIVDNCELVKNPNQKNKDSDEHGDACDGAEGESTISFYPTAAGGWNLFSAKSIFVILIILGLLSAIGYLLKDKIFVKK